MSLDIFWFLPTSGDTRYLGKSDFGRPPTNEYMRQIAVTADQLGYDGLLIPTGSSCQDPWVTAASLIPVTQRFKLLALIGGSVVVETVFGWPGLGQLSFEAIKSRDVNLLVGVLLLSAFLVVLLNLIVDLLYGLIDPHTRSRR